jgi:hypothetical protein
LQNSLAVASLVNDLKNVEISNENFVNFPLVVNYNGEKRCIDFSKVKFSHCRSLLGTLYGSGSFLISIKVFFVSLVSTLFGNRGFASVASLLGYGNEGVECFLPKYLNPFDTNGENSSAPERMKRELPPSVDDDSNPSNENIPNVPLVQDSSKNSEQGTLEDPVEVSGVPQQPVIEDIPLPNPVKSARFFSLSDPQVSNMEIVGCRNKNFSNNVYALYYCYGTLYHIHGYIAEDVKLSQSTTNYQGFKLSNDAVHRSSDGKYPITELCIDANCKVVETSEGAMDDGLFLIKKTPGDPFFSNIAIIDGTAYDIEVNRGASGCILRYCKFKGNKFYIKLLDRNQKPCGYYEIDRPEV